jgi:DNA-binding transcriptional LysR family regulator
MPGPARRYSRLVELLGVYACNEIKLYATYPSRQYLPPRTRAFIDFMVKNLNLSAGESGHTAPP